jgi:hypothetical protein
LVTEVDDGGVCGVGVATPMPHQFVETYQ